MIWSSSASSRCRAAIGSSPGSTLPPGNSQPPASAARRGAAGGQQPGRLDQVVHDDRRHHQDHRGPPILCRRFSGVWPKTWYQRRTIALRLGRAQGGRYGGRGQDPAAGARGGDGLPQRAGRAAAWRRVPTSTRWPRRSAVHLPEQGIDPLEVVEELIAGAEPGLVAMPSGRFFGWVIGGVLPAALGADWLTSAWDQNAGLLVSSPAAAGAERVATGWLLDLLGLPSSAAVGYVTGGDDGQLHLPGRRPARGAAAGGLERRGRRPGRRSAGCGCWSVRSGTTRSTWRCASWVWVRRGARWWPRTSRDGSGWTRWPRRWLPARPDRPSSACRPGTCTAGRSTPSATPSTWPTGTAPGCTSTARSGCGPRPRRGSGP